ncbi:MAG: helix-turn-helix domain-containing protein [Rhodospirillales bacterium]|nr:helix-turn-helix domain-containing protein [Rhodospirillales bacterium]
MPKLTHSEFELLRPRLGRLAIDTIDVARAVLVDGMTPSAAARHFGMTRQRVHGIVQRFRAAAQAVPTAWRRVDVWLPPELAAQVEAMAEAARAAHVVASGARDDKKEEAEESD